MDQGHIGITQSGTTTKFLVDPHSYSEVDIVDFAPRAVTGTPSYSALGLYLDVGQDKWNHGFGQWEYSQPQNYQYTGHLVDTRHAGVSLMNNIETLNTSGSSWTVNKLIDANTVVMMASTTGINVRKPSDGSLITWPTISSANDLLNNGKYVFITHSGRMYVAYIAQVTSRTTTTITFTGADFEYTDMWVEGTTGKIWCFDGTGVGTNDTITASAANTVSVASWTGTAPEANDWVMLLVQTGNAINPPNGFSKMTIFGGYYWGVEEGTHYLHFWSDVDGADAEGGGATDADVVVVGPPGRGIINLAPHNNQLWAFRSDGAWNIGTDNLAYHTLDFSDQVSDDNFAFATVWNGFLIFPVRNRIYKYRSGLQDITPPVWSEYPPYKQFGAFTGGHVRGDFLYIFGKSNSANATDESATESSSGFISLMATSGVGWHKLLDMPIANPDTIGMWLDADSNYLYMHEMASTTGNLYRLQFQELTDLPVASFPTSGEHNLYTSYYDFGFKRINKSFASVTIHGTFPTNTSVVVEYRLDDTTAWTTLGTFDTDYEEISFPAGTTGKRIQLRLDLKTTTASNTPVIVGTVIKLMMRPNVLYGVSADVIISDNLSDQHRLMLGKTATELRTALKNARNSVAPITFIDIYGQSSSAYLASVRFMVLEYEDTDAVQALARCTFVYV